jgi:tetratricopeptide (TPR) repeat protein
MVFARKSIRETLGLIFCLLLGLASAAAQQAKVTEGKLVFKTYPFSEPDPVPLIGPIYPYFKFHGYSVAGQDQEWKMVTLENPFVKVLVAPEIGGKVWGAVEKSTGREFIFWNRSIKFREIAMRGPWTSGGIEFNFGLIGHTPTTATPVDYLIRENGDGSASCIVGAIDLPSRTSWRVNIRVPKDAAYLEVECFWFNPTTVHDSLYHWMAGAEDLGDDLKFFYPGNHHLGHDGRAAAWPVDEAGRDLSYYRNNNFGSHKSYHILGVYGESFGGYFEKTGFGYGHWALYGDKPGMKLWLWSLARDGEIWTGLLSDGRTRNYAEPQTGLMHNQAGGDSGLTPFKHVFFAPQSVFRWKEIWFPVKDIGGLVTATPHAALNVTRKDGKLIVGLCPLQSIDDDLTVALGGKDIFRQRLVLKPMQTFIQELDTSGAEEIIAVQLGKEKLRWTSRDREDNTLHRPLAAPDDFDWTSAEGLFVAGEEMARQRRYAEALIKYLACLEKEPGHVRAITRTAELYFKRAEYDQAFDFARRALAIDTYDPGANFIYGVACRRLGRLADAKSGFGWAARSMEYRSAAYEQLSELSLHERNLNRAEEYARRALDFNFLNLDARQVLAVIHRLRQEKDAAFNVLAGILEVDPLSHFARFERFLLNPNSSNRQAFVSLIRNELPHETYLELAMNYFNLGLEPEAAQVLEMSPSYPVADYWLAYLYKEKDAAKSRQHLQRALEASPDLVFPFRLETIPVLRWAAGRIEHWKTTYYLALILWNIGRLDEAGSLLAGLADAPDWSPFYLARAKFPARGKDRQIILADIRRAVDLDKTSWRAWRALTDFHGKSGRFDLALKTSRTVYDMYPEKFALAMDYARALFHGGDHEGCLKVLERTTVLPYEGGWEGHDLYRRANLLSAVEALKKGSPRKAISYIEKARMWPERLGVGKPYDVDERLENYILALAKEKSGNQGEAKKHLEAVAADSAKFKASWGSEHYVSALAMKKLGREGEAIQLLHDWRDARGQPDAVVAWAIAKSANDESAAAQALASLKARPGASGWDLGTGDRFFPLVLEIAELSR